MSLHIERWQQQLLILEMSKLASIAMFMSRPRDLITHRISIIINDWQWARTLPYSRL